MIRSSHQRGIVLKEALLKISPDVCNFIKKETPVEMFSSEFCEIFKNIFFTEHLWTTASILF